MERTQVNTSSGFYQLIKFSILSNLPIWTNQFWITSEIKIIEKRVNFFSVVLFQGDLNFRISNVTREEVLRHLEGKFKVNS
jgi:hypothetical protein